MGISSDAGLNGSIILNEAARSTRGLSRGIWSPMLQRMPRPPSCRFEEAKDKEGQRRQAAEAPLDKAMKKFAPNN